MASLSSSPDTSPEAKAARLKEWRAQTATIRQAIADNAPKEILLHAHQCPGDTCVATIVVESLARQYPGRFKIGITGTAVDGIFAHNPHIVRVSPGLNSIQLDHPHVHSSNQVAIHFAAGMCDFLGNRLGVKLAPVVNRPVFYLTGKERDERLLPEPYCLLNAGWKDDGETKWYSRYQEVVDQLAQLYPWLKIVQVGESWHHHPKLRGVVDMIGAWNGQARKLIVAAHNAEFGIGPISFMLHVFAGLERPYVCLGSGYEPPSWAWYPGVRYVTRFGTLPCCHLGGCWRRKWHECAALRSANVPACLDMPASEVVSGIQDFMRGGLVTQMPTPTRRERRAVVTMFFGEFQHLKPHALPFMQRYADKIGAQLICLDRRAYPDVSTVFEKGQLYGLLEDFNRIIWIDGDALVRDDCPNLFDVVPESAVGMFNEYRYHGEADLNEAFAACCAQIGAAPVSGPPYYNAGIMVLSRCHRDLFAGWPTRVSCTWLEQTVLNVRLRGYPVHELPITFNQMDRSGRTAAFIRHFSNRPMHERIQLFVQAAWNGTPENPVIKPLPPCQFIGESIRNPDGSALTRDCGFG